MRLLHTADWHLGVRFHGHDRLHEQIRFLDWLHEQIGTYKVDALLVSGDIFETLSPSAAAQRALFQFLARVTRVYSDLQIVIIAGNHDSGHRLEAANDILDAMGVYVRGVIPRTADGRVDYASLLVPLHDAKGREYVCAAIPYLRVSDCPNESDASPYVSFFLQLSELLRSDLRPKLALAHLYATNANPASLLRLAADLGGVEGISHLAFPEGLYSYVALGHIHRPQVVFGRENVRYSGSPISMSFAERNYSHGVNLVEIEENFTRVQMLAYDSPVRLIELGGSVDEVLMQLGQFEIRPSDQWAPIVSLKIVVEQPEPTLRRMVEDQISDRYVRLGPMQVQLPTRGEDVRAMSSISDRVSPLVVAQLEYMRRYGVEMPDSLRERFVQAANYEAS